MLDQGMTSTSVSFVTNGTKLDQELLDLLKKFRSTDVEVSLDSVGPENAYVRQGSDTKQVMDNILRLSEQQTDTFRVIVRPVPQALTIDSYHDLLRWCWMQRLPVQGIVLVDPQFMQISVIPKDHRLKLIPAYENLVNDISNSTVDLTSLATGRSIDRMDHQLIREARSMIQLLGSEEPLGVKAMRTQLAAHCQRWDHSLSLNAAEIYPQHIGWLREHGYQI